MVIDYLFEVVALRASCQVAEGAFGVVADHHLAAEALLPVPYRVVEVACRLLASCHQAVEVFCHPAFCRAWASSRVSFVAAPVE